MQPLTKPLDPVDPNIKIPRAAREAAAQAEAYYKKPELAQDPAPDPTPTPAPELPVAPDKAEVVEVKDAPPLAPDVAPPAAQTPPAPQDKPPTNWEHAYKSMKGRYERSEQAVASLRAQLGELQQIITAAKQPPQNPKTPSASERLITDKDVEDYGEDLLNVVGKRAKEELNPLVSELRAELAQLRGQLQGTAQKVSMTAQERMYSELDRAMPNWRTLNKHQDFLNWLALPDRFSGVIRQTLLDDAVEQNSAPRVLAFFQGFLAEEAASGSEAPDDPAPAPVPQAPHQPAIDLGSLAAPGRAKSAATQSVPAEKPIITNAQITQFYADVRRGHYRGREAEKDAAERMISEAAREGRIR